MKKLFIIFIPAISLLLLGFVSSYASEMPVYDEAYNNNQGAIYAVPQLQFQNPKVRRLLAGMTEVRLFKY